jgi:hypothetical protein
LYLDPGDILACIAFMWRLGRYDQTEELAMWRHGERLDTYVNGLDLRGGAISTGSAVGVRLGDSGGSRVGWGAGAAAQAHF